MRFRDLLKEAELAGRLEERERIARELHDTVLQSAEGMNLVFHSLARRLARDDPMRRPVSLALEQAGQLLTEARTRIFDLRSTEATPDFAQAVARDAQVLAEGARATFKLHVTGTPRQLLGEPAREVYLIVREALVNAFKHSEAAIITLMISYEARALNVRVIDDGKGMDARCCMGETRPLHFGLQGMRERACQLGARLRIMSRERIGTEITCSFPASVYCRKRRVERGSVPRHDGDRVGIRSRPRMPTHQSVLAPARHRMGRITSHGGSSRRSESGDTC
jgi:signal transduction histidine kinase